MFHFKLYSKLSLKKFKKKPRVSTALAERKILDIRNFSQLQIGIKLEHFECGNVPPRPDGMEAEEAVGVVGRGEGEVEDCCNEAWRKRFAATVGLPTRVT